MASRQQVLELLDRGLDHTEAGQRLGIPPGQVYLIATGTAADGSDAPPAGTGGPGAPAASQRVRDWIAGRVAADRPMREAAQREGEAS